MLLLQKTSQPSGLGFVFLFLDMRGISCVGVVCVAAVTQLCTYTVLVSAPVSVCMCVYV